MIHFQVLKCIYYFCHFCTSFYNKMTWPWLIYLKNYFAITSSFWFFFLSYYHNFPIDSNLNTKMKVTHAAYSLWKCNFFQFPLSNVPNVDSRMKNYLSPIRENKICFFPPIFRAWDQKVGGLAEFSTAIADTTMFFFFFK